MQYTSAPSYILRHLISILEYSDRGGHLVRPPPEVPASTSSCLETTSCIVQITMSPKMWQEHLNDTSWHAATSIEVRQPETGRLGEEKHHVLAYSTTCSSGTSRDATLFLQQLRMLKNMNLDDNSNPTSTPSLWRLPAQQESPLDPD